MSEVCPTHQLYHSVVAGGCELQGLRGRRELFAHLDDLCVYHWLFVLIISASFQQRESGTAMHWLEQKDSDLLFRKRPLCARLVAGRGGGEVDRSLLSIVASVFVLCKSPFRQSQVTKSAYSQGTALRMRQGRWKGAVGRILSSRNTDHTIKVLQSSCLWIRF